jgi:hypothetical protein
LTPLVPPTAHTSSLVGLSFKSHPDSDHLSPPPLLPLGPGPTMDPQYLSGLTAGLSDLGPVRKTFNSNQKWSVLSSQPCNGFPPCTEYRGFHVLCLLPPAFPAQSPGYSLDIQGMLHFSAFFLAIPSAWNVLFQNVHSTGLLITVFLCYPLHKAFFP